MMLVAAQPRVPLYARIEAMLRDGIAEGRHPVGGLLPTEAELCDQLRVSRHTVREALRRLVEAGLVERRQGAGTMVVARQPPRDFVQSFRDMHGLSQYAESTRLQVNGQRMAALTPEEAALVPAEPGARWLRLDGVRVADDRMPIATALVLIHPRFAAIGAELPARGAIHAEIERRFGVEVREVVQEICAAPLPVPVAEVLGRKPRSVGLRFVRRYLDAEGETMILSLSWHSAERYTYVMRLRRTEVA